MKHRITRTLAGLLALVMLAGTVSCGNSESDDPSKDGQTVIGTEGEDTELKPELPDVTYDDEEFRILTDDIHYKYLVSEKTDGELVNDAIVEANLSVTEKFKVKFERINGTPQTYIQAGDDAYDVAYLHDTETADTALRGWFLNVYDMPYMDPTAPWWPQFTVDSLTINGKMFFYSNYTGYLSMSQTRVCFFNQRILDTYKMESPYALVRDGSWTVSKMAEMSSSIYSDLNGNGVKDQNDLFGYASTFYPWGWLEGFGIEVYQKESPTSAEMTVTVDDRCYSLIENLHNWWYTGSDGVMVTLEGHGNPSISMFAEDRVAFTLVTHLGDQVKPAIENDISYGIVPYPKVDANQEHYYGACTDYLFTIPCTVHETERVGVILEAMAYAGYRYVRPAYCEQTLKTRFATDPDCAEMLDLIFDNRVISFSYLYSTIQADLIAKTVQTMNVASFLRSQTRAEQKYLDKMILKVFRDQ
jgi:ABC-type glycerol-3-phosphate transport system substrate-binding protein